MEEVVIFMAAIVAFLTIFFLWTGRQEKKELGF